MDAISDLPMFNDIDAACSPSLRPGPGGKAVPRPGKGHGRP